MQYFVIRGKGIGSPVSISQREKKTVKNLNEEFGETVNTIICYVQLKLAIAGDGRNPYC